MIKKNLLVIILTLFIVLPSFAITRTDNLGLYLVEDGYDGENPTWSQMVMDNFGMLDNAVHRAGSRNVITPDGEVFLGQDYCDLVIALCEVTNDNPNLYSYSTGFLKLHRVNGNEGNIRIDINLQKIYNMVHSTGHIIKQIMSPERYYVDRVIFKYNNKWYAGVKISQVASCLNYATFVGDTNLEIFGVAYYNHNTDEILNQEIYDSIQNDTYNFSDGNYEINSSLDLKSVGYSRIQLQDKTHGTSDLAYRSYISGSDKDDNTMWQVGMASTYNNLLYLQNIKPGGELYFVTTNDSGSENATRVNKYGNWTIGSSNDLAGDRCKLYVNGPLEINGATIECFLDDKNVSFRYGQAFNFNNWKNAWDSDDACIKLSGSWYCDSTSVETYGGYMIGNSRYYKTIENDPSTATYLYSRRYGNSSKKHLFLNPFGNFTLGGNETTDVTDLAETNYRLYVDGDTNINGRLYLGGASSNVDIRSGNYGELIFDANELFKYNGSYRRIWDESNDGSGSGLDADLLDGIDSASIINDTAVSTTYYGESLPDGWYTIAVEHGGDASAKFKIKEAASGSGHSSTVFRASVSFGYNPSICKVSSSVISSDTKVKAVRIKNAGTYDGSVLQVYLQDIPDNYYCAIMLSENFHDSKWSLVHFIPDNTDPGTVSNYSSMVEKARLDTFINGIHSSMAASEVLSVEGWTPRIILKDNNSATGYEGRGYIEAYDLNDNRIWSMGDSSYDGGSSGIDGLGLVAYQGPVRLHSVTDVIRFYTNNICAGNINKNQNWTIGSIADLAGSDYRLYVDGNTNINGRLYFGGLSSDVDIRGGSSGQLIFDANELFKYNGAYRKIWDESNDGSGSGLDADLLDGHDSNYFWNVDNDGSGSGLDADLLDGYDSSVSSVPHTVVIRGNSGDIEANGILKLYSDYDDASGSNTQYLMGYSSDNIPYWYVGDGTSIEGVNPLIIHAYKGPLIFRSNDSTAGYVNNSQNWTLGNSDLADDDYRLYVDGNIAYKLNGVESNTTQTFDIPCINSGHYRSTVIGLCRLNGDLYSDIYSFGTLYISQYAGWSAPIEVTFTIKKFQGEDKPAIIFSNKSTYGDFTSLHPCTFTHNGVKWAGFTFSYINSYDKYVMIGRTNCQPFVIAYYDSYNNVVLDQEIFDSRNNDDFSRLHIYKFFNAYNNMTLSNAENSVDMAGVDYKLYVDGKTNLNGDVNITGQGDTYGSSIHFISDDLCYINEKYTNGNLRWWVGAGHANSADTDSDGDLAVANVIGGLRFGVKNGRAGYVNTYGNWSIGGDYGTDLAGTDYKLYVNGQTFCDGSVVYNNLSKLNFKNSGGLRGYCGYWGNDDDDSLYIGTVSAADFHLITNNSTRLNIDKSGNTTFYGDVILRDPIQNVIQTNSALRIYNSVDSYDTAPIVDLRLGVLGSSDSNVFYTSKTVAVKKTNTTAGNYSLDTYIGSRANGNASTYNIMLNYYGNVTIGGSASSNVSDLAGTDYKLFVNGSTKIQTYYGYVDIGAKNSGYMHFLTNMPVFYFDKGIMAAGNIQVYGTSTYLTGSAGYIAGNEIWHKGNSDSLKYDVHTSVSAPANLAVGWYTIAAMPSGRGMARFTVKETASGRHSSVVFYAGDTFGTGGTITTLAYSRFSSTQPFSLIRIKDGGTYDGAVLQIYVADSTNTITVYMAGDNFQEQKWALKSFVPDNTDPGTVSNYFSMVEVAKVSLVNQNYGVGGVATSGYIESKYFIDTNGVTSTDAASSYVFKSANSGTFKSKPLSNVQSEIVTATTVNNALSNSGLNVGGNLSVKNNNNIYIYNDAYGNVQSCKIDGTYKWYVGDGSSASDNLTINAQLGDIAIYSHNTGAGYINSYQNWTIGSSSDAAYGNYRLCVLGPQYVSGQLTGAGIIQSNQFIVNTDTNYDSIASAKIQFRYKYTSEYFTQQDAIKFQTEQISNANYDFSLYLGKRKGGHDGIWSFLLNSDGNVTIGGDIDNNVTNLAGSSYKLYVQGTSTADKFKVNNLNTAPLSSSSAGTVGEIRICSDAIYICVGTNSWKKVLLSNF